MADGSSKQRIIDSIKDVTNILVTVSANPSVDELSAALALTIFLNKLGKHATAVFSGEVPPAISFLNPDKTFEQTANSLRDFIIALDEMSADEALHTAVVLPDEQLLIPVLHSVPEAIRHINVTLGYPLSGTPVASLMEAVLALRKNMRVIDGKPCFYHREVLPVLNHRYIQATSPAEIVAIVKQITDNNRIYIAVPV